MANWFSAFFQSLTGRFQRFDASIAARYTTLSAAVSLGKSFRFLTDFQITLFSDSMALVVTGMIGAVPPAPADL